MWQSTCRRYRTRVFVQFFLETIRHSARADRPQTSNFFKFLLFAFSDDDIGNQSLYPESAACATGFCVRCGVQGGGIPPNDILALVAALQFS